MVHFPFFKCILLILTLAVSSAHAEVLFEGYSKILINGKHVGYLISKYEFDAKSKKFNSTYFLKTSGEAGDITESVRAQATSDLGPLSYEYTTIVGKEVKTIDATFNGLKMSATVTEKGKSKTIRKDIKKGTFLSTFLVYVMLQNPQGLKTNSNYHYTAVAEEDGDVYEGLAVVDKEEAYNGLKAFKIKNDFKKSPFTSYVNDRGEVLSTQSVSQGVSTELVADPAQATGKFSVNQAILKKLFGDVPAGKVNMLAKTSSIQPQEPGKQQGIPGGQGIQLKAQPAATPPAGK